MHRMNEKGEPPRDRSSFFTFLLFFSPSFFQRVSRAHSVWLRISIERRWWMAIGIKLCGAPALMLRNIWKLGKFDLRSAAPSGAYTFHVWSNARHLRLLSRGGRGEIYMKISYMFVHTHIHRLYAGGCSILIEMHEIYDLKFDINAAQIIMRNNYYS